ncbi:MAG: hypothetical protein ACLQBD_05145, partial [Syntrophobacteraceae bacterium]
MCAKNSANKMLEKSVGSYAPTPPSPLRGAAGLPARFAAAYGGGNPGRRSHRPTAANAERSALT